MSGLREHGRGVGLSLGLLGGLLLICALVPAARAANLDSLLAPPSACPHQVDPGEPVVVQERAMRCMTNFARARRSRPPLAAVAPLNRAARRKSVDIVRCDEFDHEACGREFTHWIERFGYRGCAAGENIAWGTGSLGSVRSVFRSWIHSPGHRRNILSRSFDDIGVGLRIGALDGRGGVHVWTQAFGGRC
jgi:uncharacterized protein YkwD